MMGRLQRDNAELHTGVYELGTKDDDNDNITQPNPHTSLVFVKRNQKKKRQLEDLMIARRPSRIGCPLYHHRSSFRSGSMLTRLHMLTSVMLRIDAGFAFCSCYCMLLFVFLLLFCFCSSVRLVRMYQEPWTDKESQLTKLLQEHDRLKGCVQRTCPGVCVSASLCTQSWLRVLVCARARV